MDCANVKPNKLGAFISLIGNESGKLRIPIKHFEQRTGYFALTPGFSPVYAAIRDDKLFQQFLFLQESC